jgi:ubiquinone/menaquinone biosynthesis C-methylase UbiE
MRTVYGTAGGCDNPAMGDPDVFDDLLTSMGGFYRSWLIYLGLELGLFAALRTAGDAGLAPAALASETGTHGEAVDLWSWAADAHGLAELEDGRLRVDPQLAAILLDRDRTDYLGGQFIHGVVATLDWDRMVDFFRTGTPIRERPDRYREAIELLTQQDIAVFFQEALAELPQAVAELTGGGRVVDVHCGGGRWLIAMARRFPRIELVGVEFEEDSVARARQHVEAEGLAERIRIVHADMSKLTEPGTFNLAYFQYALHQLPDAVVGLRTAWQALAPGGRLVVLDWPLPSDPDEFRTRHGELIAGVQLDELYQGTSLATRERFRQWFADAGLPEPAGIDLPSGASLFVAER